MERNERPPPEKYRQRVLSPIKAQVQKDIALALLTNVRQLITFPEMFAKAIDKAFLLIYVSFNGVPTLIQTRRVTPT